MFDKRFVLIWLLSCQMILIPITAGSRDLTPIDKVRILSTILVSLLDFSASTCLIESIIVSFLLIRLIMYGIADC